MADAARDLRYGRRGGRWAEGWSDEDEARYQAAKADKTPDPDDDAPPADDQPALFDDEVEQ